MVQLFSARKNNQHKHINWTKTWTLTLTILLMSITKFSVFAQSDSLLKKTVTVKIPNTSIYNALNIIGQSADCFFIYDSRDVNNQKRVRTNQFLQKPLEEILRQTLRDTLIHFKEIGKHILLYRKSETSPVIKKSTTENFISISGTIFDKDTQEPIPFATIAVTTWGLGTISNNDGIFTLKIPTEYLSSDVVVSHLGYETQKLPLSILSQTKADIYIKPRYIAIQEVIIRNIDARSVVKSAIDNIDKYFITENCYLTGFYREGVKRNKTYLNYSEAVFKVFKTSYSKGSILDQVKLIKSRKIENTNRADTLTVKLKAGIKGTLEMDILKNLPDFLDREYMNYYNYTKTDIVAYENHSAYAIEFEQKPEITLPLYKGTLYIDVEKLILLAADFQVNPDKVGDLTNQLIIKKDRGIKVKPKEVKYSIDYRLFGNKYVIQHIRGDLKLNINKRYKLFSDDYSLFFEFVNMQVDTVNVKRFTRKETFTPQVIFSEEKYDYDPLFWGKLNIIEPEEDVSKAIARINSKIESISNE